MLPSHAAASVQSSRKNPPWNGEEWLLIARELKRSYPTKNFISYRSEPFTCLQIEEAAEAVLPPERHRTVLHFEDVRADLFSAFKQAGNTILAPVKEIPKPRASPLRVVKWSPEEWEAVVKELYACHPELFGSPSEFVVKFGAQHFRRAQAALPTERHRELKHREETAQQFVRMWLDVGDRIKQELLDKRKVKEFSNAIIPGPLHSAANEQKQMSAAIQKAFEAPDKPVKDPSKKYATPQKKAKAIRTVKRQENGMLAPQGKKRKDAYWRAMALALIEQHPKADLLDGSVFVQFTIADLKKAQDAIPKEMHRKSLYPYLLMPELNEEFKRIKAEHEVTEEEEIAEEAIMKEADDDNHRAQEVADSLEDVQEASTLDTADIAEATDQIQHIAYVEKVMDLEAHTPVAAHSAQVEQPQTFGQALVAASAPLLNVIMGKLASMIVPELTKALIPEVIKGVAPEVAKAIVPELVAQMRGVMAVSSATIHGHIAAEIAKIPMPKEVVKVVEKVVERTVHVPVNTQAEAEGVISGPMSLGKVEEKPKLPCIALLGPMGAQREDIKRSYPQLDLIFIEHGKGIKEAARKSELFLISTKHQPASIAAQIGSHVDKDKRRYADGGTSSFKRQIDIWMTEKGITT